jgi:hypothetical protein
MHNSMFTCVCLWSDHRSNIALSLALRMRDCTLALRNRLPCLNRLFVYLPVVYVTLLAYHITLTPMGDYCKQ